MSFGIEVASPQCAGVGSDFYTSLIASVVSLVAIVLVLMAKPIWTKLRTRRPLGEMIRSTEGATAMRDLFVVVLLLHPTVSGRAMEFFRCREIDGVSYLMADYSIECFDTKWYFYLFIVLQILVFFSIGTPAVMAYVLRKRRDTLYEDDGKVKDQPLDILYAIYQPKAYYYESVQMASAAQYPVLPMDSVHQFWMSQVFKLGLWSALVFFEHGSEFQHDCQLQAFKRGAVLPLFT